MQIYFQNRTFLCVIFAFLLWGGTMTIQGAVLAEIIREFSITGTKAGLAVSFWTGGAATGSILSARLLKTYRLDQLFLRASILALICILVLAWSPNYFTYLLFTIFTGALAGSAITIGHAVAGDIFPKGRAAALGMLDVVFSLGNIITPLLVAAILLNGHSWHISYAIFAAFFATLCIAIHFWMPKAEASDAPETTTANSKFPPVLIVLGIAAFCLGVFEWTHMSWWIDFALAQSISVSVAQLGLSAFFAGMLVIRILTIFYARLIESAKGSLILFAALLLGNTLLIYSTNPPIFLAGSILQGFGLGCIFPIFLGRAMDVVPDRTALASATMIAGNVLGAQFAGIGFGWLRDNLGIITAFRFSTVTVICLIVGFQCFRIYSGRLLKQQLEA